MDITGVSPEIKSIVRIIQFNHVIIHKRELSQCGIHVLVPEHAGGRVLQREHIPWAILPGTIWRWIVHLNHVIIPKGRWFEIEYNRSITGALRDYGGITRALQRLWEEAQEHRRDYGGRRRSVAEIMGGGAGASQRLWERRRDYGSVAEIMGGVQERRRDYGSVAEIMGGAQERCRDYGSVTEIMGGAQERCRDYGSVTEIMGGAQEHHTDYRSISVASVTGVAGKKERREKKMPYGGHNRRRGKNQSLWCKIMIVRLHFDWS
ncbi:hypothetical protein L210DRAFT_3513120 [Boletus edulis BED1]|uniref:Uncharacterized protein n=1 Tax=Boletus edulis BED1 TaxID=1328754 RepID=A0AAD4G5B8_BOLED|nr:hypothetical protein L210DRAFT_3513120 [Boletus edulis BED1]